MSAVGNDLALLARSYREQRDDARDDLCQAQELIACLQARIAELETPNATMTDHLTATLPVIAAAHIADGESADEPA